MCWPQWVFQEPRVQSWTQSHSYHNECPWYCVHTYTLSIPAATIRQKSLITTAEVFIVLSDDVFLKVNDMDNAGIQHRYMQGHGYAALWSDTVWICRSKDNRPYWWQLILQELGHSWRSAHCTYNCPWPAILPLNSTGDPHWCPSQTAPGGEPSN